MPGLTTVNIPDLGEVEEVEVIEICAEIGQPVGSEDSIIILETDKAAMEIPASLNGIVKSILVKEGDIVKEGVPFLEIEVESSPNATEQKNIKDDVVEISQPEVTETKLKSEERQVTKNIEHSSSSSVHSGPATRKLAREFGINLSEVNGSGPKGRILKEDLHAYVSNKLKSSTQGSIQSTQPDIDFSKWGEIQIEKLSKFQKTSLKNLHNSWISIPHVTQHDDADITELLSLRNKLNKEHELKISPLAFIIKATVETLKLYPVMNTSLNKALDELVQKNYFNIGIAIDTPDGLIVPNIKNVDSKSIFQISNEVNELASLAKTRKLKVEQLKGATFTISSLSGIGGKYFTPIINPPEVGILGLSKTYDSLSMIDKNIITLKQLPISLSYDHRIINGAYAAKFIVELGIQLKQIDLFIRTFKES